VIEILQDLNKVAGVKGCMVVTQDGIVVNSALGSDLDQDIVAAVSSALIKSARDSQDKLGYKPFKRFIQVSSWGRMVFVDIEIAYLVVITTQNIKLDVIVVEIDSTARRIRNRRAD
jgi:hypothetical protein